MLVCVTTEKTPSTDRCNDRRLRSQNQCNKPLIGRPGPYSIPRVRRIAAGPFKHKPCPQNTHQNSKRITEAVRMEEDTGDFYCRRWWKWPISRENRGEEHAGPRGTKRTDASEKCPRKDRRTSKGPLKRNERKRRGNQAVKGIKNLQDGFEAFAATPRTVCVESETGRKFFLFFVSAWNWNEKERALLK